MRPFTIHIYYMLFLKTIFAAIVIKATKYSMYFIIHKIQIQSLALKKCKVVLPDW